MLPVDGILWYGRHFGFISMLMKLIKMNYSNINLNILLKVSL